MPIYMYRCRDCEHEFEVRQRMMDDPLTDCPVCDGSIRRVVNSVGVVFKGSGFYVTDSRKSQNSTLDKNGSSDAESKTTTSTDDKKPDKSETKKSEKTTTTT